MCATGDSARLKGLQWWMISRPPSRLGATMPIGGWIISCKVTYVLSNSRFSNLFLLGSVSTSLGESIGAVATPDGAFSPISSTFGGPPTGIPSSKMHRPHWGHLPWLANHWELDQGIPLKFLPSPSEPLHLERTSSTISH